MKIFIFGQSGMLGRYVYSFLANKGFQVVGVNRNKFDIVTMCKHQLSTLLLDNKLSNEDVIINCAGLIKQRSKASKFDFVQVNAVFPYLLQHICDEIGCHLIHVTTDCVFDGLNENYDELSVHDARDVYGITKSLGEPEGATIIRTSIIGEELRNFNSLLEWVKSNKNGEIRGYTNHIWNGITCLRFAKICKDIIKEKNFWRGVKHITSPHIINKYDLVKLISDVYNLNIKVIPFETGVKCDRSLTSIRRDVSFEIPELKEQLIRMRDFYNILKTNGE